MSEPSYIPNESEYVDQEEIDDFINPSPDGVSETV